MNFSAYTNRGNSRDNNEDSYLLEKKNGFISLIAVADGMGGHRAGEIASQIVVEYIKKFEFNFDSKLLTEIKRLINEANNKIIESGSRDIELKNMGTTLSLGIIEKLNLYIGHVGDSRIYLYRDGELKQLTSDHSLVNELLVENKIEPDEAFNHPQKHILTQALGVDEDLRIETRCVTLTEGDHLLFCTDGLTDMVRASEIKKIIKSNYGNVEKLSKSLGNKALNNGGNDNITLITGIIN